MLSKPECLILDVDGVLTNSQIMINSEGQILRNFNVKDGLGIKLLIKEGIEVSFMSGGNGYDIVKRAESLGVRYCFIGINDKKKKTLELQQKLKKSSYQTAYIGDDFNDLRVSDCSLFFAPSDAIYQVKSFCSGYLYKRGGEGVVRELAERILKAKGKFNFYLKQGLQETN